MGHDFGLVSVSAAVPAARGVDNFSATATADHEIVLFDNERLTYHTLNSSAFAMWQSCDGRRTVRDILLALQPSFPGLTHDHVELAVLELSDAGLLAASSEHSPVKAGIDRRKLLRRAVIGATAATILPAVSSVTSPVAADHTSCGSTGTNLPANSECVCSSECYEPFGGRCCCSGAPGHPDAFCTDKSSCEGFYQGNCLLT